MKRNYSHIAQAIYRGIWIIQFEVLDSIKTQFENYIKNPVMMPAMPKDDEDEEKEMLMENKSGIAVITIEGIIGKRLSMLETMCGGQDVNNIEAQLIEARDNPDITSILLDISSPGGTFTGVPELAELISDVDKVKAVYAYTDTLAASAAYWLGSQARAFYASPSSKVGSVGVYSLMINATKAYEKEGKEIDPIVSKGSPMKLAGANFRPMTKEERSYFQSIMDKIYDQFVGAVKTKRNINDEYLDGRVFSGEDALKYGLIDGTANSIMEVVEMLMMVDKKA